MEKGNTKVCVTGGSGYIGSWLVNKLLLQGYTVHATLTNLEDKTKVSLLRSLPGADTNLVLFQADIYNPDEFEPAIHGCEYVFHVATPRQHDRESLKYKSSAEATVAGVKSIADSCVRLKVKRLIYTASVTASSVWNDDGNGFRACIDESCWTPLNLCFKTSNDINLAYTKGKTLAEKEVLKYNENEEAKLEVFTLTCGVVSGETLLPYLPRSVQAILSQLTGSLTYFTPLCYVQELLRSVPLVHVDDVVQAHIFCMENQEMPKGRYLCASSNPTLRDIAMFFQENHPQFPIDHKLMGEEAEERISLDSSKLMKAGFKYQYDTKEILEESFECGKRLGALCLPIAK